MKNQNLTLSPDQLSKAMNLTIRGTTGLRRSGSALVADNAEEGP